ncbi:MAG: MarR family winged helix-turn-helix transcriptional regulator [Janthinobacterium lividum]
MQKFDLTLMSLSVLITQVSRRYKAAFDKMAGDYQLSHASAWPMVMISRLGDGVRPGAVADAMGMEAPSLVRIIEQLSESGLVERRDDVSDRRAKTLHLTEEGKVCAARLEKALLPFRRELFAACSAADIEACLRVMSALDVSLAVFETTRAAGSRKAS